MGTINLFMVGCFLVRLILWDATNIHTEEAIFLGNSILHKGFGFNCYYEALFNKSQKAKSIM